MLIWLCLVKSISSKNGDKTRRCSKKSKYITSIKKIANIAMSHATTFVKNTDIFEKSYFRYRSYLERESCCFYWSFFCASKNYGNEKWPHSKTPAIKKFSKSSSWFLSGRRYFPDSRSNCQVLFSVFFCSSFFKFFFFTGLKVNFTSFPLKFILPKIKLTKKNDVYPCKKKGGKIWWQKF